MATPTKVTALKTRRTRIDNPDGQARSFANAKAGPPTLPSYLDLPDDAIPFWDTILRARALEEWGAVELTVACQLATKQALIKALYAMIQRADREELDKAGYPSMRSAQQHVQTLEAGQFAHMRALSIVGNVAGDPLLMRRQAERQAEEAVVKATGKTKSGGPSLLAD